MKICVGPGQKPRFSNVAAQIGFVTIMNEQQTFNK